MKRVINSNPFQVIAIVLLALCLCFMSCTSGSGNRLSQTNVSDSVVRAKVVENNTIAYVRINRNIIRSYEPGDTVWVNLATHRIDDVSDISMKAVLYPDTQYSYYDGEGNRIPNDVVKLYVKSHFVNLDSSETNKIKEYFY